LRTSAGAVWNAAGERGGRGRLASPLPPGQPAGAREPATAGRGNHVNRQPRKTEGSACQKGSADHRKRSGITREYGEPQEQTDPRRMASIIKH